MMRICTTKRYLVGKSIVIYGSSEPIISDGYIETSKFGLLCSVAMADKILKIGR